MCTVSARVQMEDIHFHPDLEHLDVLDMFCRHKFVHLDINGNLAFVEYDDWTMNNNWWKSMNDGGGGGGSGGGGDNLDDEFLGTSMSSSISFPFLYIVALTGWSNVVLHLSQWRFFSNALGMLLYEMLFIVQSSYSTKARFPLMSKWTNLRLQNMSKTSKCSRSGRKCMSSIWTVMETVHISSKM